MRVPYWLVVGVLMGALVVLYLASWPLGWWLR